ncbi:MAG: polysaccharide deacetylase family protein [Acidimicrobiales bacterium]
MTGIDVAATLEVVRRRNLDCEGVPMVLALNGARAAPPDDPRRAEGRRLARLVAAVHATLAAAAAVGDGTGSATGRGTTGDGAARSEAPPGAPVSEAPPGAASAAVEDGEPGEHLDSARAVSREEALVAEAVSVAAELTVGQLTDDPVPSVDDIADLDGGDAADLGDAAAGSPVPAALRSVLDALREGRWLTVVNYHNTPASSAVSLREELAVYGRHYAPVSVEALQDLFATGEWGAERPPLIPVFYEGYRNNYEHAAPACEGAGLVGWFFLITTFLATPPAEQVRFARAHHIGLAEEELERDRIAMSWAEAAELAGRHVVTSHTATHCAAHRVMRPEGFASEVVEPSELVRDATGRPSPAHAWLYGTGLGRSPEHDIALRHAGYQWCFGNLAVDDVAAWTSGRFGGTMVESSW